MIRPAKAGDERGLRRIWAECFGDPEAYVDFFFQNAFEPEKTLVCEEGGAPCAMLFLLDCSVWIGGREVPAAYLYAAATLPAYRSRGIMGRMIGYAADYVRSCGYGGIVLVPAEPGLFDYYGRFGFQTCFYDVLEELVSGGEPSGAAGPSADPADFSALEQMRRTVLKECGGMMWNGRQFDYALREHLFTGGRIFQTQEGYALYHCAGDVCSVDEMIALPGREQALKQALCSAVPVSRFRIVHPCGEGWEARPRGMLLDFNHIFANPRTPAGHPYIGLTLG